MVMHVVQFRSTMDTWNNSGMLGDPNFWGPADSFFVAPRMRHSNRPSLTFRNSERISDDMINANCMLKQLNCNCIAYGALISPLVTCLTDPPTCLQVCQGVLESMEELHMHGCITKQGESILFPYVVPAGPTMHAIHAHPRYQPR